VNVREKGYKKARTVTMGVIWNFFVAKSQRPDHLPLVLEGTARYALTWVEIMCMIHSSKRWKGELTQNTEWAWERLISKKFPKEQLRRNSISPA